MDDEAIVALYHHRDPEAIPATERAYGRYCSSIARNILFLEQDVEECVNDTWLHAWNAMPPHRPARLGPFLGRITRNLALNRWAEGRTAKRGGGELPLILEELGDTISGSEMDQAERYALAEALNSFLAGLRETPRIIFIRRYWYCEPVRTIARDLGRSENAVSASLVRLRQKLRQHLTERGIGI